MWKSNTSGGGSETIQNLLKNNFCFFFSTLNSITAVKNGNGTDSFLSVPYSHFPV